MMPLEGRSKTILIVSVVIMAISIITACLRCWVRLRIIRAFGWDDALMVVAVVLDIALTACSIAGSKEGIGRQLLEFRSRGELRRAMLWWWLGQCIYLWASGVAKVSIALALLRLTVQRAQRITLWIVVGTSTCVGLVFWFILLLQCHPISEFWERTGAGTCLSTEILLVVAYVYSSICAVCDFVLGLLPILLVRKLQMNPRTKVALAATLSLGCVASTAVIVRIPFLPNYKDEGFLYSTFPIDLWSFIEVGLGITAGSLVTLRPLFRKLLDGSGSRSQRKISPGSIPLSSLTEETRGEIDPKGPPSWRPQTAAHTLTTTIFSPLNPSPVSSTFYRGMAPDRIVRVQKSFYVTEHEG
ncbi:P-type ATPase [Aspergillus ellipticus CBS 707.79]|uniref:P-type ATPase n=1 Tax=Aspergillus ellipticus CBS 707.79 TaxID=1448320 RepID=A0A319DGW7_9EURO|nr:P-type ATPase [Aspergillus ellipticus CBS 707.79]